MAVNKGWGWEKRRPYGLSQDFKDREMLWLWCRLLIEGYRLDVNLVSNADSRANHLIESLSDSETVAALSKYQDECFAKRVDDSEFNWIDFKNKRLVLWLLEQLKGGHLSVKVPYTNFDQSVLKPKEQIQLAFDISPVAMQVKKQDISDLRQMWSSLIDIDPSLDWIDKKNDDQCRWLVSEIQSSDLAPWISSELQFPVNSKDRFHLFINALDRSGIPLQMKRLFVGELKSKWSRRQKKLDGKKVQCNLNVDSLTKENIRKLSDHRGLKMGELIDALAAEEIERLRAKDVFL